MSEMKTLTFPGDSEPREIVDAKAREELAKKIPAPETASPGQTIVVKAVDENGKPTEWEAVDMSGGGGLTTTASALLLAILKDCYTGSNQDENILALENELLNNSGDSGSSGDDNTGDNGGETEVTLTSISAVVNEDTVAVGTAASDLDITVTAHYSDGSTAEVIDYSISGTVASGANTFTIVYGGKTTTVTVTGAHTPIYALYNTTVNDYTSVDVNPFSDDVSMTILIDATVVTAKNARFFYMRDASAAVRWQVYMYTNGKGQVTANGVASSAVFGNVMAAGDTVKIAVTRQAGSTTCEVYWYQRTAAGVEYCHKDTDWDVGEFVATKDFTMMSGSSTYNSFEVYTGRYFTEAEALEFTGCAAFTEV